MVFYSWEIRGIERENGLLTPSAEEALQMVKPFPTFDDAWYRNAKAQWFEPFNYQAAASGKRVRTELAWALSAMYGLHAAQTHVLCDAVEGMNLSSLVHDDLLDGDTVRRGIPTVWKQYGAGVAIVSGMCGYLEGLQRLAELNELSVVRAGIKSLERLHVGQYLDAQASDASQLPTLEEYALIAQANTSCFFVFLLEACQCLKPLDQRSLALLNTMMHILGVYYRYVNDYCDLNHVPHFAKKGFANDLEGGPKSFLMILAGDSLLKGQRTSDQKKDIIRNYGEAGVFDTALTLMEETYNQILDYLNAIKQHDDSLDVRTLEAFLRDIHFQQSPDENYYQRMLA